MFGQFLTKRGMKGNWIIIALTGFALVAVVLLAFRLHYANKKEVLYQSKDHQFLHAQNIAKQIESVDLKGFLEDQLGFVDPERVEEAPPREYASDRTGSWSMC